MRAFYSTQNRFRVFILGTPEGWHVSIFDLQKQEWVENSSRIADALSIAKTTAHEQASQLLGKNAPEMKWH